MKNSIMSNVYLVTRPNGSKKCYDFIGRLEKEEGLKKGSVKEKGFPFKEMGYLVEILEHDSRL